MTDSSRSPVGGSAALRSLQLKDIIVTLPQNCFQKRSGAAWRSVALSVTAAAVGYVAIAYAPWFLLPLAWVFTGTALTGWFVIAHDCGHRSFAQRPWVNDLVGHVMMLPLLYPFHSWRLLHNHHHIHTNKLEVDNAWEPWQVERYENTPKWLRTFYRALRGRLWWVGSIAHWAGLHFAPGKVAERDRPKVVQSVTAVVAFAAIFFPTLLLTTGPWGVVSFWLMPWLVYHFWMSTFTIVHHTLPEIPFRFSQDWHPVEAQLAGTVHCTYPRWVEILCHDINVHVPHHISTAIPSYNLRLAHDSLTSNWGEHLVTTRFSWSLMGQIVDRCHLYHEERGYQSFKEAAH
ncbi:MAG: fatty acid desaturase [Cyanobacteria bacterium P01_A01_bin.135]